MTLETLAKVGIPIDGLRSKPGDDFAAPGAPLMDFVFTVCVNAAGETCPMWPGQPMTAHWRIENPASVQGPEFKLRAAFEDALRFLRNCIGAFINLPLASIDRMALNSKLEGIGEMEAQPPGRPRWRKATIIYLPPPRHSPSFTEHLWLVRMSFNPAPARLSFLDR